MNYKLYKLLCLVALIVMIIGNFSPVNALSVDRAFQTSNTYFVATNGNDSNAGTEAAPWLTVRKALATIKAGDTLIIRGGQYSAVTTGWYLANSGTASQPITITNYPGEQVLLIAPAATVSGNYVIKCTPNSGVTPKADYVRIIGTDVSPRPLPNSVTSQKGIVMMGVVGAIAPAVMAIDCDFWEVAGVDFVDVAYGIFTRKINHGLNSSDNWNVHNNRVYGYFRESGMQFNGNYNRIENNEIYKVNNRLDTPYGCQLLNLLGNNNIVRGNTLSRLGSTSRCIGILLEWDLADANLIENNVISEVPNGITSLGGDGNTIRNNRMSGTDTAFVLYSYADTVTAYPCNFTEIAPYDSAEYIDRGYYYPHDCRSKNNLITGNILSGFTTQIRMSPLQESSNSFIPLDAVQTVIPTTTATPTAAFTLTPEPPPATQTTAFTETPTATTSVTQIVPTATFFPTETPPATVTSLPTTTPAPTGQTVITSASPKTLLVGETSLVSVNMVNIPVEGYASVEFTCTFAPDIIKTENIQVATLFGNDPVSAFQDLQNGSFILAIAGSNGNKALTDGLAFTFTASGLKAGQSGVDCAARVSTGENILTSLASLPDILTVLDASSPTATPVLPPTIIGQVIAGKPVTVSLLNSDSSVAAVTTTNSDGTFLLTTNPGSYIVIASAEGYLNAQGIITLADGINSVMPTITLPAGDIDGNDVIDQYDALTLGMNYNVIAPTAADLSNDGLTNILDLELLAENYRKAGALAWQ